MVEMMERDDEIDLLDCLRVVRRWGWLIIIVTLISTITAGVYSFLMPEIYKCSMMLEPGTINIDEDGRPIYFDSASDIKVKVDSHGVFKASVRNSNTLDVELETENIDKGKEALLSLLEALTKEYNHYIRLRKIRFDQEIGLSKQRLMISAGEKHYLEGELKSMKANTGIIKERAGLIDDADKLTILIYTNVIQQDMVHYSDLNRRLKVVMTGIEELRSRIETLRIERGYITNIRLVKAPRCSLYPVKPKKRLNIMLGFVVGLFASIFLAFIIEYFQRMKANA